MIKKYALWAGIFIVQLAGSSWAKNAGGTTAGLILLRAPGAAPMAMAEAYSSVREGLGGVVAMHYNPGANAQIKSPAIAAMGQKSFSDQKSGSVFFAMPSSWGALGAGVVYDDDGSITLIDNEGHSRTALASQNFVGLLNYAADIDQTYDYGLSVKVLHSRLIESFSATAYALDLGGQIHLQGTPVSFGFAVQNAGGGLTYIDKTESLPLTLRGGLSHYWRFNGGGHVLSSLDVMRQSGENVKEFFGVEYGLEKWVLLRGGYKFGQDNGSLNFGLGLSFDNYGFDYAYTSGGDLGAVHTVSLSYRWAH